MHYSLNVLKLDFMFLNMLLTFNKPKSKFYIVHYLTGKILINFAYLHVTNPDFA